MATHPTTKHATSAFTYSLVFGGLLVLTATTVLVAHVDLGPFHTFAAVAIAVAKASLVVLFFMHALESDKLVHLIILGALLWLAILLGFTLCDFWSRGVDLMIRNPVTIGERRGVSLTCGEGNPRRAGEIHVGLVKSTSGLRPT